MKIAVLLSGGVDSSVALARLVRAGYTVEAFYLKIWLADELAFLGDCPWEQDLAYARAVAEKFAIPLHIVPLQQEYRATIISYIIDQVKMGNTPSPDVLCNRFIKFGCFLDHIDTSFTKIASGHYGAVRGVTADGSSVDLQRLLIADPQEYERRLAEIARYELCAVPDRVKDQTYFLSQMTQAQIARVVFPVGDLQKHEVREIAQRELLATAERKDSQGVCFLGKISFKEFVKHYVGTAQGKFVEYETGRVLGEHEGTWFYTIGQRRGIPFSGGPWYVVAKDVALRVVFISREYFSSDKPRRTCTVNAPHWIAGEWPTKAELVVKIRHGEQMMLAQIAYDREAGRVEVTLPEDDQGLASGQFVVFYDGDVCLGSGAIAS